MAFTTMGTGIRAHSLFDAGMGQKLIWMAPIALSVRGHHLPSNQYLTI